MCNSCKCEEEQRVEDADKQNEESLHGGWKTDDDSRQRTIRHNVLATANISKEKRSAGC